MKRNDRNWTMFLQLWHSHSLTDTITMFQPTQVIHHLNCKWASHIFLCPRLISNFISITSASPFMDMLSVWHNKQHFIECKPVRQYQLQLGFTVSAGGENHYDKIQSHVNILWVMTIKKISIDIKIIGTSDIRFTSASQFKRFTSQC